MTRRLAFGGGGGGEVYDFAEELGGLAETGGDQDGFGIWVVEDMMKGSHGGCCGLAPLAATVDEDAAVRGVEDFGLLRFCVEIESLAGPAYRA